MRVEPVKLSEDLICIVTAAVFQGHPGVGFVKIIDEAYSNIFFPNQPGADGGNLRQKRDPGQYGQRLRHNYPVLSKMGSTAN
jgi:hypothetical protein